MMALKFWFLLTMALFVAEAQDYVCKKGKQNRGKTIKIRNGDSYSFKTQAGATYAPKTKCFVTYKRKQASCPMIMFTCSEFNIRNNQASCKSADRMVIKEKGKKAMSYCQQVGPDILTSAATLKVSFISKKGSRASGAVCTVSCYEEPTTDAPTEPTTTAESETTTSGEEPVTMTTEITTTGSRQGPLENDSKCGIPTGGRAECYFDCAISTSAQGSGQLIKDLTCLQDCFSSYMNEDDYCITSLLNDVISKGVCNLADEFGYNPGPGIYKPVVECGMSSVESNYGFSETVIDNGTCSDETEALLMTKTCRREIMEEQGFIQNTLLQLLQNSCNHNISQFYVNFMRGNLPGARSKRNAEEAQLHSRVKRLAPAQVIYGSDNISTILDFENTQNRYSWVCSLQSTGSPKEHLCAVTLLNLPPNPTVIVGAAHCTYLCKDDPRQVPPCCCSFGPGNCAGNKTQCGNTPKVAQMAEGDATIVCGRWKYDVAEEKEIVLDITEIVRHPDFDQARGPLSGSDIAVFKVDDSKIDREKQILNPACLPSNNKPPSSGIHAGWSKPPPISYINNHAKEYAEFYDDFFKQWHYKMDILDKCEDPTVTAISGAALQFPSNSSYPAGTVCAKDFSKQSCFSTGESGSPLMIQSGDDSRYSIEGILSFVKGCDVFTFGTISTEKKNAQLNQQTENPSTYTKLACYLSWIAEQYGMDYEHSKDPACQSGSGNPDDGDQPCRITPSNLIELFSGEVECIFPFYYKGTEYNGCILFEEDGFVYPVFRCPTRNITTKIEEINSFEFLPLVDGYCPTDSMDPTSPLDPNETNCSPFARRSPFSQCKNNCPGVQALGIIGG